MNDCLVAPWRRGLVTWFVLVALGSVTALPARAEAPRAARSGQASGATHDGSGSVNGLIVQLRDAPGHWALARERTAARAGAALSTADGTAERESRRWQGLVAGWRQDSEILRSLPAWERAAPQRDPVGSSAQLLRFERPLSRAQAEAVAARLALRPDVAWVTPNVRERRQATAQNAPNDPDYAGTNAANGQWWLQPVGGVNSNPISMRLRGVPSFLPAWLNSTTGSAAAVVAVLDSGITCHPELGNLTPNCIGGAILPGYDFVADWDPVTQRGYANDGDGRDADPRDPGDWVNAADRGADPTRYASCDVEDSSWHGTTIAGIVAAQTDNNVGVAAINWNGRVLPVRVAGKCGADVADIIEGMRWAAGLQACKRSDGAGGCSEFAPINPNPARIVNISFGGSAACSPAYQQAIDELRAARFANGAVGAVVVAAAGNGFNAPSRPANCERVLGVTALNRDGFKANYANFGPSLAIATVGGDDDDGAWGRALGADSLADSGLLSIGNSSPTAPANCTGPGANCYFFHFGTSFAAPIVAGTLSLMLSLNPALTLSEIEQGLARTARPHVRSTVAGFGTCSASNPGRCLCTTSTCGAGILDATRALAYAVAPTTYAVPVLQADVLDSFELRAAAAGGPDRAANASEPPPASGGSSGGGGMGALGLFGLALATWVLRRNGFSAASRKAGSRG